MKFVVVEGNPCDGIKLHGIFPDAARATGWADTNMKWSSNWWVMEINPVGEKL